jgi:hypothetical protein
MSQHPITSAIVLAGGLGTRLRSAVPDLPKPMAPIAGRPFLAHQLDQWIAHGIRDFVLAVGYRHEAISDYFGAHYRGASIRYSVEATPLGTGGALLCTAALRAVRTESTSGSSNWAPAHTCATGASAASSSRRRRSSPAGAAITPQAAPSRGTRYRPRRCSGLRCRAGVGTRPCLL